MNCKANNFLNTISLDGEWTISYCDIGKGSISSYKTMTSYPYNVPNPVHTPLIENGIIKEPLIGMNDKECTWIENTEFWCSKTFCVADGELKAKTVITFGGLDCTADIWINNEFIGRHSNSFVEIEYDITQNIRIGENIIVVRIDQGLEEVKDKDLGMMKEMWNNEQPYRSYMRKPQYVYGWDWTIWLATCGIWKSIFINTYDTAFIKDVYAYSANQNALEEGVASEVKVDVELDRVTNEPCTIECTIYGDKFYNEGDRIVAEYKGAFDGCKQQLSLTIDNTHLWWSNGLGKQYLYHIVVELKNADGKTLHTLTREFGARSITINEDDLGDGESTFTFVLNKVPVFSKGANHVPSDCLFGRVTPERNRQLIKLAKESNMNMLRIWGGGIYESEEFMNACDRAGIMVWHDFMYACGYYPDYDEKFMNNAVTEAEKAIKRLRNHSSLIGWSGNNEIQGMYNSQKQWIKGLEFHGETLYTKVFPELIEKHCKNVIYRESSPIGGDYPEDMKVGDQHIWEFTHIDNHPHYLDLWRFTDFNLKFLSEFGIIGAMNLESAKKCIPPEHLDPDDEVWLHHTNSCHNYTLLNMMVDKYFGDHKQYSIQEYILRSQVLQAEITRHIYDECRCRKFVCSGLLFWTLGDSFGIHNWSIIDYYLQKRPLYYYLKRSMEPVSVAIRGYDVQNSDGEANYKEYWASNPKPLEIWGTNDTTEEKKVIVEYSLMTLDGRILRSKKANAVIGENTAMLLETVALDDIDFDPEKTILYTAISADGKIISDNRYFFAPFAKMPVEKADVKYNLTKTNDNIFELEIFCDSFVWMLHMETPDNVEFSDNDFDLIPGVTRKVTVTTTNADFKPVFHWVGKGD